MKHFLRAAAILAASAVSASAVTYSEGATEADNAIREAEKKGVIVGDGEVVVDYIIGNNVTIGTQFTGVNNYNGNGLSLGAGTYNSYLIHFDPIGNSGGTSSGSFTFGENIVALILSNGNGSNGGNSTTDRLLNNSDAVFGLVGDTFETDLSRRSESNVVDGNGDRFTVNPGNVLTYSFKTGSRFIDNVRVITAVPVPASLPLLLAGLGGLAFMRRRRKS